MYQEDIAKITADHLRTHIAAYLAEVDARFTEKVKLVVPKSIDVSSVVGGMWERFDEILPQYGVDVLGKSFAGVSDGLFTWEYLGQINGMVHGGSEEEVDLLIKRHGSAVEAFVRRHQFLHQVTNNSFTVIEFAFAAIDFSGAENILANENQQIWVAGFSMDVAWLLSEDGPSQHA